MDLGLPIWGYPHDLGHLQIEDQTLIAVLTPLVKHPDVKGRILRIEPRLGHDSKKDGKDRRPGTIKIIEK